MNSESQLNQACHKTFPCHTLPISLQHVYAPKRLPPTHNQRLTNQTLASFRIALNTLLRPPLSCQNPERQSLLLPKTFARAATSQRSSGNLLGA
ncbi:unnamed protein product [Ceratitis capitata]|uniref:(Mediterranean fruit fly) hypothetical protein n=1 Tax=Ceratitis capitata TaxID=7213 RepID=A0A811V718_CERCA|nr:unnamed protein product [Ceratitis capitata]